MSKFIQTVDVDKNPVIINLEAITHVSKTYGESLLAIYFPGNVIVILKGANADMFWELFSKQSLHIYEQLSEDKK